MKNNSVEQEVLQLKQLLEHTVKIHEYNFCHPDVLAVSQRLDQVIVRILYAQSAEP